MDIKTQLNESLKEAMRLKDNARRDTLRMVLAAIKQAEVDERTVLDDLQVIALLQKEIKNRREALQEARKANRADLVQANEAEIAILEAFLPKALSADELRQVVEATIAETGATSLADMSKVVKAVLAKVTGRARGDQVSAIVRELLSR